MQTGAHTSWHELPVSEVAELLETDLVSGLSAAEVESRLKQYGPNKVTEKPGTPAWKRFLLQFHQPLIYILLVASGLTLALGEVCRWFGNFWRRFYPRSLSGTSRKPRLKMRSGR